MFEKKKITQKGEGNYAIIDSQLNISLNIAGNSDLNFEKYSEELDKDFQEQFFETKYYKKVLDSFNKNSIVFLLGIPGIGKTFTSKQLCSEYEKRGYFILYSENINENNQVREIIDFISKNSELNIFILLDDFLGLIYKLIKSGKDQEISKLIKKVKKEKSRIKMLINSRFAVYNEFKSTSERTTQAIESSGIHEITIDPLDFCDKAGIFYNHLIKAYKERSISEKHYFALLNEKKYLKIILNPKFNPRVIEYVTVISRDVKDIAPEKYFEYIILNLVNPDKIWDLEIKNLQQLDRVFIFTLFSLTKTNVNLSILRDCFDKRIKDENSLNLDTTISQFEVVSTRLQNSIIKIDEHFEKVGVLNPSINDWLYKNLMSNSFEINKIITSALYHEQIECFDSTSYYKKPLIELIKNKEFSKLYTLPKPIFKGFNEQHTTPSYLYKLKMLLWKLDDTDLVKLGLDNDSVENFILGIFTSENYNLIESESRLYNPLKSSEIFCKLFSEPLVSKYNLTEIITNKKYLEVILNSAARDEVYFSILNNICIKYKNCFEEDFYNLVQVKNATINNIVLYVGNEIYDQLVSIIKECAVSNIDDYVGKPFDDFVDTIYEEIRVELEDMILNIISEKLYKENIEWIDEKDFDVDTIISDEIELNDIIFDTCSKYYQSEVSEYNDNKDVEQEIIDSIEMFESAKFLN
ncbi:hypothetical protein [Paenibacillus amylolyticus]|uniref:Novel STAND NTPase 3 domain-containing protein n=1 Tax=Paenibacillus amylolyticus TaxID=1451 RepID=A0ABD8AWD9_PAEAM